MIYPKRKLIRPIKKIVAYYRVSEEEAAGGEGETRQPCYSLETQRRDVARFAAEQNAVVVRELTEIASGTLGMKQRAELYKAVGVVVTGWTTLVVGRQDRLACDLGVICELLEWEIDFVSVDKPDRTRFEIHCRAIFDEDAARTAARRTSDNVNSKLHHVPS